MRASPVVHMDENGLADHPRNGWLWAMLSTISIPSTTLRDKSRSQKVVGKLLGQEFDGTLVTDFYGGYRKIKCEKQKCLTHLLRELRDTAIKSLVFAGAYSIGGAVAWSRNCCDLKSRKYRWRPWRARLKVNDWNVS